MRVLSSSTPPFDHEQLQPSASRVYLTSTVWFMATIAIVFFKSRLSRPRQSVPEERDLGQETCFRHIAPDSLDLFKVSIPTDTGLHHMPLDCMIPTTACMSCRLLRSYLSGGACSQAHSSHGAAHAFMCLVTSLCST
jgi:hypothetical protein